MQSVLVSTKAILKVTPNKKNTYSLQEGLFSNCQLTVNTEMSENSGIVWASQHFHLWAPIFLFIISVVYTLVIVSSDVFIQTLHFTVLLIYDRSHYINDWDHADYLLIDNRNMPNMLVCKNQLSQKKIISRANFSHLYRVN